MTTPRPTILVIDDEPSVLHYVRAVLERMGFGVVTAERGVDALTLLENTTYHGVISDMRTPGEVDGAGVHVWLRQNRPELARRMLFITGDTANEDTLATLRRCGAPFIEKPISVKQLISAVEQTFGGPA
jgi:DNA-binding NtrC family response regulator